MTQAIFLSYASQDADAARRICDAMRTAGLEVWFDQSELRGGDAWDASIRKQIKECALFVPIISHNTQQREEGYFRLEWKLAVDRSHLMADNKAFFVPVILGDVAETAALVPDKFRERQWTRLNSEDAIKSFTERVVKLLAGRGSLGILAPSASPLLEIDKPLAAPSSVDDKPSIAVLAFANRSGNPDDEYFSDGLADELLNMLAKIKGLRVAARTSAFSFKGKPATIAEIGRTLNVATVLEGSVRKSGNRARIFVQLVKVADGYHLWSETFDRTLDDIFAVQDEIAQDVVTALRTTVLGADAGASLDRKVSAEVASAMQGRSENAEAHRLQMQAGYLLNRHSGAEIQQGIQHLRDAVAADPGYALAWAQLSRALTHAGAYGFAPVAESNAEALAAAERALQLAPELAEVHLALCMNQLMAGWDWQAVERHASRGLALAPENPEILAAAGLVHYSLGRNAQSIDCYQRALERDPLNSRLYLDYARPLVNADRLAEAERACRRGLELSPDGVPYHYALAETFALQGRLEEAIAEVSKEKPDWARLWGLGVFHHMAGNRAQSDAALQSLVECSADHAAAQIAAIHAVRGEFDAAFAWVERAYAQRDSGILHLKVFWQLRGLRADPRWKAWMRLLRFED